MTEYLAKSKMQVVLALFMVGWTGFLGNPAHAAPGDFCKIHSGNFKQVQMGLKPIHLCVFGKAMVQEETLQRDLSGDSSQAVETFWATDHEIGATAVTAEMMTIYCTHVKGTHKTSRTPDGIIHLCQFPDDSIIEARTLYGGRKDSTYNGEFMAALEH